MLKVIILDAKEGVGGRVSDDGGLVVGSGWTSGNRGVVHDAAAA